MLAVAVAVLGSWVPFHIESRSFDEVWGEFVASLDIGGRGRGDFTANVLLGVPLGFLLISCLNVGCRRSFVTRLMHSLVVVAAVVCQGLVCELGQGWIVHRVPSSADVLAQMIGGIIGVTVWWTVGDSVEQAVSKSLGHRSLWTRSETALSLAAVGVLIWSVLPLDVLMSPAEIMGKWTRGGIELVPFTRPNTMPMEWLYQWAISAVIAMPLGLWAGITLFPRLGMPTVSTTAKLLTAVFLGALPELLQIPIAGRVASATDALFAIGGVYAGIEIGQRLWPSASGTTSEHVRFIARPSTWFIASLIYWISLCLVAWYPFDFVTDRQEVRELVKGLAADPFSDYRGSNLRALFVFFRLSIMSTAFGALMGIGVSLVVPRRWRIGLAGLTVLTIAMSSLLIELGQLFEVSHTGAGIGAIVRMAAGVIGLAAAMAIVRGRRDTLVPTAEPAGP